MLEDGIHGVSKRQFRLGHIKLPNVIIEKKRWIHTGDDQPMESALTHICILPNNA